MSNSDMICQSEGGLTCGLVLLTPTDNSEVNDLCSIEVASTEVHTTETTI